MSDYDPSLPKPPYPERAVDLEPGFQRFQSLITPEELKSQYLFGIPLRSALTKDEMPLKTLEEFIVRAISRAEHELKIQISPVKYADRYNYDLWDYQQYNFIQLLHWPILQIESVKAKYPNSIDFIQYPSDWFALYGEFGQLQLTPTNGQLTQFFLTNDATYIPLLLGARMGWPQLWQITYVAGFQQDKIPAVVNDYIATLAAINAIEVIGPVLFPYTGYGVGIDGVSQSISAPGPQLFQTRLEQLAQKKLELADAIKTRYNLKLIMSVL